MVLKFLRYRNNLSLGARSCFQLGVARFGFGALRSGKAPGTCRFARSIKSHPRFSLCQSSAALFSRYSAMDPKYASSSKRPSPVSSSKSLFITWEMRILEHSRLVNDADKAVGAHRQTRSDVPRAIGGDIDLCCHSGAEF